MILITGAAGKTGQAITQALVARGESVRAFVRRREQVSLMEAMGVKEVVVGDIAAEGAYREAVQGCQSLYHICPNMNPAEVKIGQIAIATAQAAGVGRFVYHSVLHPQTEQMPHHWHKLRVEALLFESGLDFTILQPAAYMQNVLASWPSITEQGLYRMPYPVETRLGMVDLADVAEVAAKVLTEQGHSGAIYELSGPDALTQRAVAEVISAHLDRPVQAEQMSLADWQAGAKASGLGQYQLETLVKMFQYYEAYGFWGNAHVLEWLLDRPATTFAQFVARLG